MAMTETAQERPAADATPRLRLRAWLRGGSFGPTELSRRGCLLVLASVLAVLIPVVSLTLMAVDAHLALKVWVLAITVIAVVGAVLRVVADVRPDPQDDLDRAGKAIGAVAALYTALAVIIDWSLLHL
ncbi:hypothetical protein GSU68_15975 [Rathayibacter sp. VKM Ac-2759]|uniref:hypothetical protein n=1 Tax=Rathayibacter sp. VKM Ac-2759 TaxID=2609252 RepID=UPI00131887BA|nr:hypothetical protein [Rathayibacter sp. VKM Ac-2759]QHC67915.1 hypothetical protein GSU68_15975 [Rathayibacter sp. VKM Ac-2759]